MGEPNHVLCGQCVRCGYRIDTHAHTMTITTTRGGVQCVDVTSRGPQSHIHTARLQLKLQKRNQLYYFLVFLPSDA